MKQSDQDEENIAALLRSQAPPLPLPSPGLEARILRELDRRQHRKPARLWPWLLLPPAFAAAVVMISLLPKPKEQTPVVGIPNPPEPQKETPASVLSEDNPLEKESIALRRDANRAGRFLIDCLPSVGSK